MPLVMITVHVLHSGSAWVRRQQQQKNMLVQRAVTLESKKQSSLQVRRLKRSVHFSLEHGLSSVHAVTSKTGTSQLFWKWGDGNLASFPLQPPLLCLGEVGGREAEHLQSLGVYLRWPLQPWRRFITKVLSAARYHSVMKTTLVKKIWFFYFIYPSDPFRSAVSWRHQTRATADVVKHVHPGNKSLMRFL